MSTQYSEYPVLNFFKKPEKEGVTGFNGLPVLVGTLSTQLRVLYQLEREREREREREEVTHGIGSCVE